MILAGGEGSRLAADGLTTPKALIDVAGRPQLLRLVEQFAALGCSSITCMLNETALEWLHAGMSPRIAETTRTIERLARVVPCRTPSSLHTFVAGLEELPPGPVFATMVDSVLAPDDWARLYELTQHDLADGADAVLAVTPATDPDDAPLWVATDATRRVVAIGATAASARGTVTGGVYGFGPAARRRASEALASGLHRMRIFLGDLVASGADVRAVEVPHIIDIDHRTDLERADAYMKTVNTANTGSELS